MDTWPQEANPVDDPDRRLAPSQLLVTAEQASVSLAICRTKIYELLRNGELESIRIGGSRRIPAAALAEYVERLRVESRASADIPAECPTVLRRLQGR
jgi:excisionase family DNA binding protein